MLCFKRNSTNENNDINIVPQSLRDITSEWCENMLKKGSVISKDTKITNTDIRKITNEEIGVDDGGGFSGSVLVKLVPTYSGNVIGNEPASMVCKISGNNWNITTLLRFFDYTVGGCNSEELFSRQEGLFFQKIAPLMQSTHYGLPKCHFVGVDDKGNSTFTQYVILNKPSKVRSIMVMEDLCCWKSLNVCTCVTRQQIIACLKNVAILHAKFWGNKEIADIFGLCKMERDNRKTRYSKFAALMRKRKLSSPDSVKKTIEKLFSSDWIDHSSMRLPKDKPKPDWLTIEPLVDGSYVVMKDPLVMEMFSTFSNRIPNYYQHKLKQFKTKEPQTLLHGDIHSGNHMYGTGENEGKVIAVDFQMAGSGMAVIDVTTLLTSSWHISNFQEIEDFAREYHSTLVENGVKDYNWIEFKNDFELIIVERMLVLTDLLTMMKPTTFFNMVTKWGNEQKADGIKKAFDSGFFNANVLFLTSMYVKDKDNFLIVS